MRGQITIEFAFMVMLALIFFTVALILLTAYIESTSTGRKYAALQDESVRLQQELLVAAAVEDGYQRTIILPTTLDGYGYSIANTATAFTLTLQDGTTYSREIPIVTGNFWAPGNNTICKVGGELRLNNPC